MRDRDFHLLTIRVPRDLADGLREAARRDYESQAAFVRRLLRAGLSKTGPMTTLGTSAVETR